VLGTASDPGDTCMSDADCLAGICVPPGGGGRCIEGCTAEGACPSGLVCMDGSCWPDALRPGDPCVAAGDPCTGGVCTSFEDHIVCVSRCTDVRECDSGLVCVPGVDGSGICVPVSLGGGAPPGDGCGCSVSRRTSPVAAFVALLLAGLWLARGLTRRRRPR
jgi:MYXO-CTERM domain-containing protein